MFFPGASGITAYPERIVDNLHVPPVVLTDLRLFGTRVLVGSNAALPKSITAIEQLTLTAAQSVFSIDFSTLSYMDPDRNRYRHRLEPLETEWSYTDNRRRSATYTTLAPGTYLLRVQGSNNHGVWNESGVALRIRILPPWYGTWWFRALCAAVLFLLIWMAYQYRVRQLQHDFHMRLEERLEERGRIARELHDTLLQSFQGLMFSFQAARNLLPGRSEDAIRILENAIRQGDDAITEGRDAIQGLRANAESDSDLEHLLRITGKEFATSSSAEDQRPAFQVAVEGNRQTLSPLIHDEVYRIAREILRNAFRHAHATRIEVEIAYDSHFFRLRIRDDGKGIDPKVLHRGARGGHWGLPGMRERAERLGANFRLWSEVGTGTEAELSVPARVAYQTTRSQRMAPDSNV
jgi:signal transduction histidine kinase